MNYFVFFVLELFRLLKHQNQIEMNITIAAPALATFSICYGR